MIALLIGTGVAVMGQEPYSARVEIDPKYPTVNEEIRLDISIYGEYFPDLRVLEPDSLARVAESEGPFVRPIVSREGIIVSYVLRIKQAGRNTIGIFQIRIGQQSVSTEPVSIYVYTARDVRAKDKPRAVWRVENETPVAGETTTATLELTVWERLVVPEQVSVNPPKGVWFEEIPAAGNVRREQVEELVAYVYPLKSFLLTSSREGAVLIPSAKITFRGGESLFSESESIRVLSPPPEIKESGAIGEYRLDAWLEKGEVLVGDDIVAFVRVEGHGNLKFLKLPVPTLEGGSLIGERVREDLEASVDGYVGSRTWEWRFRAEQVGNLTCTVPAFVYLSMETRRVERIPSDAHRVVVSRSDGILPESEPVGPEFRLRSVQYSMRSSTRRLHERPGVYLLFLPGLVICVGAALIRRKGRLTVALVAASLAVYGATSGPETFIAGGLLAYAEQDYHRAIALFEEARTMLGDTPALLYNTALCHYRLGADYTANHLLRVALKMDPGDTWARQVLERIEERMGIEEQVSSGPPISPDIPFIALVIAGNVFLVVLGAYLRLRSLQLVVPLTLMGILALGTLVLFGATLVVHGRTTATAMEASVLKRIPEEGARDWLDVEQGTGLRILKHLNGFYFVRTGLGVEGWIDDSEVILDQVQQTSVSSGAATVRDR